MDLSVVAARGIGGVQRRRFAERRDPQRPRQTHIESCRLQRHRSGTIFDQRGYFIGGAEIRLMDDAGLAVNASALDNIVVELVGLLLGDERRHIG